MKKTVGIVNVLLVAATALMCVIYRMNYNIVLKAVTASGFVLMGGVNLVYALVAKKRALFPTLTFLGLLLCMIGDVVLFNDFIIGAAIFVIGHIVYIAAYCCLHKPALRDLLVIAIISAASVLFVTLCPAFKYGSSLMTAVAVVYAVVISFMLGKSVSNLTRRINAVNIVLLIGSLMFFVSDIALAFNVFGGASAWSDLLCLLTYFPGQCVIAFSVYMYNIKKIPE